MQRKQLPTSDHDETQIFLTHDVGVTLTQTLDSVDYIQVYPKTVLANGHGDSGVEINSGFKNTR